LIDYKHDDFSSAFLAYFPSQVTVHPGDTVEFKNSWSGEPHTVTMGSIVDALFNDYLKIVMQYESRDDAIAHGIDESVLSRIDETFSKLPPMTYRGYHVYQPGAKPCFVKALADVPRFSTEDDNVVADARCPTGGSKQPAFNGKYALYNSGFIPFEGQKANTFSLKVADDAVPGTYNYFCTFHWTDMHGTVTVAPRSQRIPSAGAVRSQARKEITRLAKPFVAEVKAAKAGKFGKLSAPLAGLPTPPHGGYAYVDDFFPSKIRAKVGQPVTWSVQGTTHTVSFAVPRYFPVFTVGKKGDVLLDKRVDQAVGWKIAPAKEVPDGEDVPTRAIDVGKWDGLGGFHSSGFLNQGDTFTLTFTRPGTYPYACVLHPPMIGQVVVTA
jgi:plastocyanin